MSRFLNSAAQALQGLKTHNDISSALVRSVLVDLRLHHDELGVKPPTMLSTYMDWNVHHSLSAVKHLRLLSTFSQRLAELHGKKGFHARHPDYGSEFTTHVIGMDDLFREIRGLFAEPDNIFILSYSGRFLYRRFAYQLLLSLKDRELMGGEGVFIKSGKIHQGNIRKYYGQCQDIIVYSMQYSVDDNIDDRVPRRLVVDYAAFDRSCSEIFERRVNVAALNKHDIPIEDKVPPAIYNRDVSLTPNNPASFMHVWGFQVERP